MPPKATSATKSPGSSSVLGKRTTSDINTSSPAKAASTAAKAATSATRTASSGKAKTKEVKQRENCLKLADAWLAENPQQVDNQYTGFVPPQTEYKIDVVSGDTTPEDFYQQYVSQRKPCIIDSLPRDATFTANRWVAADGIAYMKQSAGDATVQVETRASIGDQYGVGQNKRMRFADFLDLLSNNDELHYLTTQEPELSADIDEDSELLYQTINSPLTELINDFPLRPALLHTLIPYQYNLWMGRSAQGSTSGLHHDFHDNLYVLLSGSKKVTIFPPSDAMYLQMRGRVTTVHPNGLINYESCPTRADGVPLAMLPAGSQQATAGTNGKASDKARGNSKSRQLQFADAEKGDDDDAAVDQRIMQAEVRMNDLEQQIEVTEKDKSLKPAARKKKLAELRKQHAQAEAEVEAAMDSQLSSKMQDDYEDSDGDESVAADADNAIATASTGGATAAGSLTSNNASTAAAKPKQSTNGTAALPDNFSAIPPKALRLGVVALGKQFATLIYTHKVVCNLKAGQQLYLPASWFHEVTSYSDQQGPSMALNYWFHPPVNSQIQKPYSDDFIAKHWERIRSRLEAMKAAKLKQVEAAPSTATA